MIFWLIGIAANFYGWFCDFDESRRKQYYGKQEGNLFFRAKNGQLNVPKAVVIFALVEMLPSVLLALFLHYAKGEGQSDSIGYWAGACWNAAFAVLHYLTARKNIKKSKENRVKQIARRAEWQAREWTPEEFSQRYLKTVKGNDGEEFLVLFAWIRATPSEGKLTLAQMLIDWSRVPEDQAWPDKKYHPKSLPTGFVGVAALTAKLTVLNWLGFVVAVLQSGCNWLFKHWRVVIPVLVAVAGIAIIINACNKPPKVKIDESQISKINSENRAERIKELTEVVEANADVIKTVDERTELVDVAAEARNQEVDKRVAEADKKIQEAKANGKDVTASELECLLTGVCQ